ncbi:MAG: hypothetical protein IPL75_02710 [Acidobacteria bacterium]|nr:hypothetical protein [Acidobacteriota bacterium]
MKQQQANEAQLSWNHQGIADEGVAVTIELLRSGQDEQIAGEVRDEESNERQSRERNQKFRTD